MAVNELNLALETTNPTAFTVSKQMTEAKNPKHAFICIIV